jgi:hypothetical protein
MENIKKIKINLKTITKKNDFKSNIKFSINFQNSNTIVIKKSKLTKIQFLNSSFSNIKKKNEIKFPLEITNIKSTNNLINSISQNLGIIKLKSVIILDKNIVNNIELTQKSICSILKTNINNPLKTQILLNSFILAS